MAFLDFFQHYLELEIELDRKIIDPRGDLSPESFFEGGTKK